MQKPRARDLWKSSPSSRRLLRQTASVSARGMTRGLYHSSRDMPEPSLNELHCHPFPVQVLFVGKPKNGINRQPESRPNPDVVRQRLAERDAREANDNRTTAERWLGDPPADRSALRIRVANGQSNA